MPKKSLLKSPLFTLFLVVFIDLVGFGIVIPILPYYAKNFGASATELGWLMASYSGMQFFFAPIWGRLSDRIGRRPVLLGSMLGISLSMVWLGSATSLVGVFAARLFGGLCAANISTATAYVADITTSENRAKGMGLIGAAFGLGFIFGPAIGGVLSAYGFSTPMFFAAGLSLCNIVFAFYTLKEPDITASIREKNRTKRFDLSVWKEALSDSRSKISILVFFLVTFSIVQLEVCFALFVLERFGLHAREAGMLLAFMGLTMAIVQGGLIGKISKIVPENLLVVCGAFLMAIAVFWFSKSATMTGLYLSLSLLALGSGITNPSLLSLASKGARVESRGATMGVYQSAGSLARMLAPPLSGWLFDTRGSTSPFLFGSVVYIAAFWIMLMWSVSQTSYIRGLTSTFKNGGLKAVLKKHGWKVLALFFCYYLVRDVTLYILLPWLAAKGVLSLN